MNIPLNIKLLFLPPYCPELNPAEKMWDRIKRTFTNKLFHSLEQLSLFIENTVNTIDKQSVISTYSFPCIFLTHFGMKYKSPWYKFKWACKYTTSNSICQEKINNSTSNFFLTKK